MSDIKGLDSFLSYMQRVESSIDNIIPACKRCNSSKCATEMLSWYKRQPFFNHERLNKILRYLQEVINV